KASKNVALPMTRSALICHGLICVRSILARREAARWSSKEIAIVRSLFGRESLSTCCRRGEGKRISVGQPLLVVLLAAAHHSIYSTADSQGWLPYTRAKLA